MFPIYFLSALVASYICGINGQSCNTPSGGKGQCVSIYDCEPLLKLVQNPNRTPQELQLLQNSKCSFQGDTVMVCCPAQCTTPEGEAGKCVSIYSCEHLANRLRPPVSQENRLYVQNSKCKGSDAYSVCCGPAATSPVTSPNKRPPSNNLNTICSAKQTAFPPDPTTDCCGYDSRIGNKIIGGNVTTVDMYPWLGIIEYDRITPGNRLLCGCVLISGRYCLTAAHCIGQYAINTIGRPSVVRLGEYDTNHEGEDCMEVEAGGHDCTYGDVRINIERFIPHPEYTALSKKNDIGLIRLISMAPFTEFIRPICLPTYDITLNPPPAENFTLYAAGWGATENATSSNLKLHVGLPYVDLQVCQRAYNGPDLRANLWDRQLCAGGQPGKDSCKGDSGGPLMYENGRSYEVLGVVNFGPRPCAQPNIPGVYAKVFAYRDWILSNISN
ncbi:hypothetical protein K1T71_012469 [Dendrolimus kikuchii]|uniref:Uncharacterized protein n=1 Tax=Dendrolimus kikuchii TaxID=765133 RepID=A0ACC1CJE9_9NEOP|nr:hypothetical protein K1T71_012469 [Dendrolimus kikuchii]